MTIRDDISEYSPKKKNIPQCKQKLPDYIVVTPAYNEQDNIQKTIDSMVSQEHKPLAWVIVDDGSSDNTWEIVLNAANSHSWIIAHKRNKTQDPKADGLIAASEAVAFLEGYEIAIKDGPVPDYIVKLDSDLQFDGNYFKDILLRCQRNPRLGIVGGIIFEYKNGELVKEVISSTHVRGATKIYRQKCYQEIGGVPAVFGWDVIDEMLARHYGWEVESFSDLHIIHLRRTASRVGRFKGWARNGYMAYYIGMSPGRILLRCLYRAIAVRDIVQASGLGHGYFSHFFRRSPKLADKNLLRIVKQNQWMTEKLSK